MQKRNLRILQCLEIDYLKVIGQWQSGDKVFQLSCSAIPPDAELIRVWHDQYQLMFCFLFYHPSFEEVGQGVIPQCYAADTVIIKTVAE